MSHAQPRLAELMGGPRTLELAKRAAIKIRCELVNGSHRWVVTGAEKGRYIIQTCQHCGSVRKVEL
jgi:hypothetical protein